MPSMSGYHGTKNTIAQELSQGKIDVAKGGGELGQGFYLSDALYVAKAWAMNKYGSNSVLQIIMDENYFYGFDILALNYKDAMVYKRNIRRRKQTRTYKFFKDMVWSPILGKSNLSKNDQYKWESKISENFLNGPLATRLIR